METKFSPRLKLSGIQIQYGPVARQLSVLQRLSNFMWDKISCMCTGCYASPSFPRQLVQDQFEFETWRLLVLCAAKCFRLDCPGYDMRGESKLTVNNGLLPTDRKLGQEPTVHPNID